MSGWFVALALYVLGALVMMANLQWYLETGRKIHRPVGWALIAIWPVAVLFAFATGRTLGPPSE